MNKPYSVNMRHKWEWAWHYRLVWFVFGDKLVQTTEFENNVIVKVIAYKMFNITYVHKVFLNDIELKGKNEV